MAAVASAWESAASRLAHQRNPPHSSGELPNRLSNVELGSNLAIVWHFCILFIPPIGASSFSPFDVPNFAHHAMPAHHDQASGRMLLQDVPSEGRRHFALLAVCIM